MIPGSAYQVSRRGSGEDRRAADKLEAMVADLGSEQRNHALRELIIRLRNEMGEYHKYLALVKGK